MPAGPAARVAGWQKRYGSWPAGPGLAGTPPTPPFPQTPLDVSVAIYVDASWIDIIPFVLGGRRAEVVLTRGRSDEASQVDRSVATFQLNNRDGQFSPRNPTSWLYGKIGRNTQVRIAIGADIRFSGEISEWPPRWDTTGTDIYVPLEASGILRRLTQGATPLKSALYRGYASASFTPKAYWPCEDGSDATSIASAIGGKPMQVGTGGTTLPSFGSFTGFKCSEPLPTLASSEWTGTVPAYAGTGNVQVFFLMHIPTGAATVAQDIINVYTTGTVWFWRLSYAASDGKLRLEAFDADGTVIVDSGAVASAVNDKLLRVDIELSVTGSDVHWQVLTQEVGSSIFPTFSGTLSSRSISRCSAVRVNIGGDLGADVAIGHISVHDQIRSILTLASEANAFTGETAGRRIERLCGEEAVAFRAVGDLDATTAMGPQLPKTLVELLREAGDADLGILYEPRDLFGLAYRTRESLYRQAATLALDYSAAHLSEIEPVDDDQATRNDITVQRVDGSSVRAVQDTGPLSISPPPEGVGRYDEQVTVSLQTDGQLPDQAGWRLHLGTVDEARYPVLQVDLARAPFTADTVLALAAQHLDVGDRLTVANPPSWLPPDLISQLAQGFVETLGNFTHRIAVNCSPETPWGQPAVYDDGVSRYSSDGSTLAASLTTTDTSVDVATPSGPLWSHADSNFFVLVGGESMWVTAISGVASPQTFTVTRSANNVVKTHAAGETVELAFPSVYVP